MIINKTPHPVIILNEYGETIHVFEQCPKDELVRLKSKTVRADPIDGIPISITEFGDSEGLQLLEKGIYYIVSQMVKSAAPNRTDLLVPAEVCRNKTGDIIGCMSLGR